MPRVIPLSEYATKKNRTLPRTLRVFRLQAIPRMSPIDINVQALIEESTWSLSDRLRFWNLFRRMVPEPRLTIRKLNLDEKALVSCRMGLDGTLSILSNNEEYATRFFRSVFVNIPFGPSRMRNWTVKREWTGNRTTVRFFGGMVDGALGWGPQVPHEVDDSLREAYRSIEKRNWKSCVVMCRRALQALMEHAYATFFGAKPGSGLDLNAIIRRFEARTPPAIPRYWLNIADSIRNLGNVPGAHPRPIPGYRFSKHDAILAYDNTSAFVTAYFERIAPNII